MLMVTDERSERFKLKSARGLPAPDWQVPPKARLHHKARYGSPCDHYPVTAIEPEVSFPPDIGDPALLVAKHQLAAATLGRHEPAKRWMPARRQRVRCLEGFPLSASGPNAHTAEGGRSCLVAIVLGRSDGKRQAAVAASTSMSTPNPNPLKASHKG
jgi:hypothetical protein